MKHRSITLSAIAAAILLVLALTFPAAGPERAPLPASAGSARSAS